MTQEQLAELHGLSVSGLKRRISRGVPLDAPRYTRSENARKGARPKGVSPDIACQRCPERHHPSCYICPHCGIVTAVGKSK